MPRSKRIFIAPSILSADLTRLAELVKAVEEAGADMIHVDVMDGHFVPNLTFGPLMVAALRRLTELPLDVHLMVEEPQRYFEPMAKAGASILTIHQEATPHLHRRLGEIKVLGLQCGLALKPTTPVSLVEELVEDLDLLLVMSVNPGFAGQSFIPRTLEKLRQARQMIDELKKPVLLEVDGGINIETGPRAVEAGARVLVAASAIFEAPDAGAQVKALRRVAERALVTSA